jgi:hypothetical protein
MGAPQCFDTHVGYAVSGRLTGEEPFVIVQFDEGESAARQFAVEGGAAKAA